MKKLVYIFILIAACKDVYNPPLKNAGINYLVVEGNIVAGNDSTFIHLTRTLPVNDTSKAQPELNATVKVESEDGETYQLTAANNGVYFTTPLNINPNKNYRLHIFTANGKEYASDYVPVKITPPIDSVSWEVNSQNGVNIFVNTHDATNSTLYYRWQYVATWEHRGVDSSELVYENHEMRQRLPWEQIYRCWTIDTAGSIFIASTTNLSSDVIYKQQLVNIPYDDEKLSWVYSIQVTQNALTKEGYEFWDNLKKNTEELGSIFDPQPFADYGNIHCLTDSSEPVLGYISACSTEQKRIFIYWDQVRWPKGYSTCQDTLVTAENFETAFGSRIYLPVYVEYGKGVHGNFPECVDCRLHGGSTTKPPYMP